MFGAANVCPCIVWLKWDMTQCVLVHIWSITWSSMYGGVKYCKQRLLITLINILLVMCFLWKSGSWRDAEAKCSQRSRMATLTCAIPSCTEHTVLVSLRSRLRFPLGSLGFFCRSAALGSTQPLVEMRTRDVFGGGEVNSAGTYV